MWDVRSYVSSNDGARLRIESKKTVNRNVWVSEDVTGIGLNYGDKIICVYGSVRMGLIFTKEHNGVSVNLASIPQNGERKEILLSSKLLKEILRESLAKSKKAEPVDTSNLDLSRMSSISGR